MHLRQDENGQYNAGHVCMRLTAASILGCTSCTQIYYMHSSSQANSAFCEGGGKERAEDAADYGRERARAAQDRLNRTADSYPSGGEIRREGKAAVLPALLHPVTLLLCGKLRVSCCMLAQTGTAKDVFFWEYARHPSGNSILTNLSNKV